MSDDKLLELEQIHGKGRVIDYTLDGVDLYFTVPTQGDHERFVEKMNDEDANKPAALREYVLSSLAHPEREIVENLFGKWPGAPNTIGNDLRVVALGGIKRREKKSSSGSSAAGSITPKAPATSSNS
jgi:hypothetical protein